MVRGHKDGMARRAPVREKEGGREGGREGGERSEGRERGRERGGRKK